MLRRHQPTLKLFAGSAPGKSKNKSKSKVKVKVKIKGKVNIKHTCSAFKVCNSSFKHKNINEYL